MGRRPVPLHGENLTKVRRKPGSRLSNCCLALAADSRLRGTAAAEEAGKSLSTTFQLRAVSCSAGTQYAAITSARTSWSGLIYRPASTANPTKPEYLGWGTMHETGRGFLLGRFYFRPWRKPKAPRTKPIATKDPTAIRVPARRTSPERGHEAGIPPSDPDLT